MAKCFYEVGLYYGRITQQALSASGTGTPQLVLRVKILGIPDAVSGDVEPIKSQFERTIYISLTEKTLPFVIETLGILGFTGTKISQLDPAAPNGQSLIGKEVDLWCSHEEDMKGDMRERWQISKGSQAIEVRAIDPKKSRALDNLFGKALSANKAAEKIATRKAAPAEEDVDQSKSGYANPEISDSEIPANFLGEEEDENLPF